MATLYLYRFRYLDPLRNKWVTARYVAEREQIERRYAQYEIVGEPETRRVPDDRNALSAAHFARGATL
jgi:hypothetical protein